MKIAELEAGWKCRVESVECRIDPPLHGSYGGRGVQSEGSQDLSFTESVALLLRHRFSRVVQRGPLLLEFPSSRFAIRRGKPAVTSEVFL
jgi:hypothetical protein